MRIDLLSEHAQEIVDLEGWAVFQWEAIDGTDGQRHSLLTGEVAPPITRGKNKGKPNWRKADRRTRRQIVITDQEHERWLDAWEKRTGSCRFCRGERRVLKRWTAAAGAEYKPCPRCAAEEVEPCANRCRAARAIPRRDRPRRTEPGLRSSRDED